MELPLLLVQGRRGGLLSFFSQSCYLAWGGCSFLTILTRLMSSSVPFEIKDLDAASSTLVEASKVVGQ